MGDAEDGKSNNEKSDPDVWPAPEPLSNRSAMKKKLESSQGLGKFNKEI